jgi:competence protein ComEC
VAAARFAPFPFAPVVAGALLAGVLLVQLWPRLPPTPVVVALATLGLVGWIRGNCWRPAGAFVAGIALACGHGQAAMDLRLPAALAGQVLWVEGTVQGLPQAGDDHVRFGFRVEAGEGAAAGLGGRRLRLGWYARPPSSLPAIDAGSRWRLPVRLRRPRGLVNPGGFDFERRALEQRLAATGQVVTTLAPRRLGTGRGLDALRARLGQDIAVAVPPASARFVAALALGDTRGLSDADWQVLRATGLTHLIAISGFHVGLVGGFGALLAAALWRLCPGLGRLCPRPQAAAAGALLLATVYAALAGFALPTVRTLLMIAAVAGARLLRRQPRAVDGLAFALVAVLVVDPLSVLAPGFWLSFVGVGWLLWCLPTTTDNGGMLKPFLHAQAVAVLGLLPLTVWFFGQASLSGPLVNVVGIPWISLVVVPLCLLGLAAAPFSDTVAGTAWTLAGQLMQGLWDALEQVAAWPPSLLWLPEPTLPALALAVVGVFWCLLPRGVPGKALALPLLLPLLWPAPQRPPRGEAELWLFDAGQGLALLVRTAGHDLLYDAGPAGHGGDAGETALVPALHALGVRRLERLMLSHGDSDHAGGADAVRRALPVTTHLAPPGWARPPYVACLAGGDWTLDGVRFTWLHPPPFFPYQRNESSCVLRIDTAGASAILPGDIGRHVEARLAKLEPAAIRADVLLVPHHGSAGSSSLDFIAAVRPRLALIAVGADNRFGLPKAQVLARYERYSVTVHDSAGSGAIRLRLGTDGAQLRERLRDSRRRYWRDAASAPTGYASGVSGTRR